ncbi:hypothetical protein [Nitrogeniibacter aestuarii]|uniref:hypothetical protein n=1 Tax=Nitrogeniibacter aestuarii TaxID=2815343 RepID=UPI001D104445|nr:hypothetical protein [Nitrogeniibacter aestuarii]
MSKHTVMLALVAAFAVAGCGEKTQVVEYKAGTYSGKPDTRPWESSAYNGDKAMWESDMRARAHKQTELGRITQ